MIQNIRWIALQTTRRVAQPSLTRNKYLMILIQGVFRPYCQSRLFRSAVSCRYLATISRSESQKQAAQLSFDRLPNTLRRFSLHGKVAVVSGGARGLGFSIAKAFADCGARGIAILDVLDEDGDAAVQELKFKYNVPAAFYKVDVRSERSVQNVITDVSTTFDGVDVLLHAAGIADSNIKAETYDVGQWRRLIDINLNGAMIVGQTVARQMITQNSGGSIIFIASMSGHVSNWPQQQSGYNASKAALIQASKSWAGEFAEAGYGIRVNTISPGYMDTALNRVPALDAQKKLWIERTPMKRLGRVDELNNLAVFLASEGSSFMTGSDLIIDGGYTVW